ncbi:MAG: EpsG family protein [Lachnospiraceae bacterium]|nr:EpsG family protein [Lachnospiraceae bacterium]
MYIYVIGTALSMFFAKLAMNLKKFPALKRSYKVWAILSFLPLTIIGAVRYNVGTDYEPIYSVLYYSITSGGEGFKEFGFNWLNQFTHIFCETPALMFGLVAFLTMLFTFMAYYQQSVNVCMSIYVFVFGMFYFNSLNQIRQALAMAFMTYAMKYMWRREHWKFFACVLVASAFHVSSLVYIPVYFLYNLRLNVKVHIVILVLATVLQPVASKLIQFVISLTPYGWYLDSAYSNLGFSLITFAFAVVMICLYYYCYLAGKDIEDKQYDTLLHMQLINVLFILYSAVIPQADRMAICMTILTPLMMPKALLRIKEKNKRLVLLLLFTAVFMLKLLHDVYWQGWYDVLPYQTLWS